MPKKNSKQSVQAFRWEKDSKKLLILDQLRIPLETKWIVCKTHLQVAECIKKMNVRGAPAIGCVAAYGLVLAVHEKKIEDSAQLQSFIYSAAQTLVSSRPTAVNLSWALERMKLTLRAQTLAAPRTEREKVKRIREVLEKEADKIYGEDLAANLAMAELGAKLIASNSVVMTICNTGSLATSGWGTALGVIRTAYRQGKILKVIASETRPYLQGARLTTWELRQDQIPHELITDNMAAHLMKTERISAVLVGADRIVANGDTANKIGTYALAVLCQYHRIPFYVVAPTSTIDLKTALGTQIVIEERAQREVTHIKSSPIAPEGTLARNPAFDVTPVSLITAIITEKGVLQPPTRQGILDLFQSASGSKTKAENPYA